MITTCLIGVVVVDDGSIAQLVLLRNRDVIISAAIVVVRIFVIETITWVRAFFDSANRSRYTIYQILSDRKNLFFMQLTRSILQLHMITKRYSESLDKDKISVE